MTNREVTVSSDGSVVDALATAPGALAAEVERRTRAAALARRLAKWDERFGPTDAEATAVARRAFDDLDGPPPGDAGSSHRVADEP